MIQLSLIMKNIKNKEKFQNQHITEEIARDKICKILCFLLTRYDK